LNWVLEEKEAFCIEATQFYPKLSKIIQNGKIYRYRRSSQGIGSVDYDITQVGGCGTDCRRTHNGGGHRRYDIYKLRPDYKMLENSDRKTIAYARVSSHDQKDDLERQARVLEMYCAKQGWVFEIITDLGSGMNYHKKGLKRLLNEINPPYHARSP
jgi:hypothetical protein